MIQAFRKFASEVNQSSKNSKAPAIIFELLSSLQILELIFLTLHYFAKDDHFFIKTISKTVRFVTGGFQFDSYHELPVLLHVIWILCGTYIMLYAAFLVSLFLFNFNHIIFNRSQTKILNALMVFHSRVLFYPIQFFLLNVVSLYGNNACSLNNRFYCQIGWFLATIALCILNFLLASIKEFLFYQTAKTKDFYAAKTNLYHQVALMYKTIILLLLLIQQNSDASVIASSVLHLLFNFGLLSILYVRLPFYKFRILKIAVVMSSLNFCLSIVSFLQACIKHDEVRNSMQIALVILPVFGVKITLSLFRSLFERILKGGHISSDYAIHLYLLLKQLTFKFKDSFLSDKSFFPDINHFPSALINNEINYIKLENQAENKKDKLLLYACVIERLENCLIRHPESQNLIIFLASLYLKKFNNIARPLELLKKLEAHRSSIYMSSSIAHLTRLLKKIRKKESDLDKNKLNLEVFFKYKKLTSQLKTKIKCEILKHLEFWKDIQKNTVDVKSTVNKVEEIDNLFIQIEKQFKRDYSEFQANFQLPILMYSVYLNNVRHLPTEASQLLRKFQILITNYIPNFEINIDSDTTTVIIISLEPNRVGQIIDVTDSMQNIFELKKKEVIGFNFGCFFPHAIAQAFQNEVSKYAKIPTYKLDKSFRAYGKNVRGEFFEVEVNFQSYSHFGEDMRAAIIIKQLSQPKPVLIVDYEGNILEYSKGIQEVFHRENMNPSAFRRLQEISYEFENINDAFNDVYGNNILKGNNKPSFGMTSTNLDKSDDKKLLTTEIGDTQKNITRFTFETNEAPILSSYRDDDLLVLNSGKKESQRFLINSLPPRNSPPKTSLSSALLPLKKGTRNENLYEDNQKLCEYFIKGKRLILFPKSATPTPTPTKRNYFLKGDVQIKPCLLGETFYKIVSIKNITKEKSKPAPSEPGSELSFSQFADAFPFEKERDIQNFSFSGALNLMPVAMNGLDSYTPSIILNGKKNTSLVDSDKESDDCQQTQTKEEKNNQFIIKTRVHIDDQRSSVMDYTFKESRFIKTLKEISFGKKSSPMFNITVTGIFLILLFIITLAGVNFSLYSSATKEVQTGIQIVYWATECLVNVEKAWGWMLFLFARAIGVGLFDDETLNDLRLAVYNNMFYLSNASKNVKDLLSDLHAEDFLKKAFEKDIYMYNPFGIEMSNEEVYDIFTATNVLVPKYLTMIQYTMIEELAIREDLIFNLNNTSNDYMLNSKNFIVDTENFLQELISNNLTNLKIVLISQSIALTILVILLISLSLIVIKAYKKLFQVLIRIRDESITSQIYQLEKARKYFNEEEVEYRTFIQSSYDMLDELRAVNRKKYKITPAASANPRRGQTYSPTRMNLHILGLSSISLLFIPILIGLFCGSLVGSMSTFRFFESVKNQIGVLSSAMYQANMFLYSFGYMVIFESELSMMIFGADPNMMIHNMAPSLQLEENLSLFSDLNNRLTRVFLKQENLDPILLDVLKSNICPYVEVEIQHLCEVGTKDGLNGLMNINADYLQASLFYIGQFMQNPSFLNAMVISEGYIASANPTLNIINYAYPFMVVRILETFHLKVDSTLQNELIYFLGECATILVSTIFILFVSIKKLKCVDLSRRKILKIIPFSVFQENRTLSFYLRIHFSKEVEGIQNIL